MGLHRACCGVVVLCLLGGRALGQTTNPATIPASRQTDSAPVPATNPAPADAEMIQLNFPENVEVKTLVDYVGRRLGLNILYDDSIRGKSVTVSSSAKIPKDSLMGLLRSVLKMSNLMLIDADQPGWKKVVQSQELVSVAAMESDPARVGDMEPTKAVTQIFQFRHISPTEADKNIRPFLSKPGGNTFIIGDQGLLLVTDYAANLKRISSVIAMVDAPGPKVSTTFIQVQHRDAADLARQVFSILQDEDRLTGVDKGPQKLTLASEPRNNQLVLISSGPVQSRVTELIEKLDVPDRTETRTYRFEHISPQRVEKLAQELSGQKEFRDRYKSVIDAESGLLIVTAPGQVHELIARLQKDLDVAAAESQSHVRFYKLLNTTASQVLGTIQSMASDGEGISALGAMAGLADASAGGAGAAKDSFTGANNPPSSPGKELPAPPAYKTTSQPSDETQARQAAPGGGLTAKTKDAIITADTNTNTLIVVAPPAVQSIYKKLISMLDKRRPQVMVEVMIVTLDTSGGYSFGVDLSKAELNGRDSDYLVFSSFGLSKTDTSTGMQTIVPGTGFNGALISPDVINAVVQALASSGRTKVKSAPRVLVNDNASATLASINEAPFTSINASQTVSTTSFAGYASAGTTITVTPHISEGDHLLLNYSVTLNSFTGKGAAGIPPPRQTNTISSEVTTPDGHTVVVGGLTREDSSHSQSRIPVLGDVPLLKYLVSSTTANDSQSTLFVFIRPIILRDDQFEDLKYLSDRDTRLAGIQGDMPSSEPLAVQ